MRSLVQFALRSPRAAIAIWLVAVVALAVVGRGVDSRLEPSDLRISGSSSAVAGSLADAQFGRSASLPVLLSGPADEVRSRGKALAARLGQERGVSVVSPWSAGPGRHALQPSRGRVLMLVSMSGSRERIDAEARRVRDLAKAHAAGPVRVQVTGVPLATHDVKQASANAIHRAELIALPVLLLILLLVFRTPLAAAIPVAFGASTVLASQGLLTLLAGSIKLDAFATGLASMVGLALAIDYSLLVVTRVRERRGDGLAQREAVAEGVRLSNRTVVVAGAAIVLAMILTAALSPTRPMLSAAVGVCTVAIVAVVGTTFALPAAMMLAGDRIGVGRRRTARSVWAPVSAVVTRRPVLASAMAMALLLIVALPVVHLRTGAPDARELPASSQARQDFQAIRNVSGPGWGAGFELVSVARRGTMTTSGRLGALAKLEATLRRDPAVRSVLGPGSIAKSATVMRRSGHVLARQETKLKAVTSRQTRGLDRLAGSVDQASTGVDSLEGALGDAGHAGGQLSKGSDAAAAGVTQLQDGMRQATDGARRVRARLGTAETGGQALGRVADEARKGAQRVAGAVQRVSTGTGRLRGAVGQLQVRIQGRVEALRGVARAARADHDALSGHLDAATVSLQAGPQNSQTVEALTEIKKAKDALSGRAVAAALGDTMTQLRGDMDAVRGLVATLPAAKIFGVVRQARDLRDRMVTLRNRLAALYPAAMSGLAASSDDMSAAMGRLQGGSGALAAGIATLTRGVGGMESGVNAGKERSQALAAGLRNAKDAVGGMREGAAALTKDGRRPRAASNGTIDSGYFVLAALDSRRGNNPGLNVAHGGDAARVLVIPRADVNSPATRALYKRLRGEAARFGAGTGTHTVAGGPAAMLIDYEQAMSARMLAIVLALAAATTLLLVIALRAVLVPLIGVALNVLCAAATLGIVERLFGGANPALGGPGHVDPTSLTAIFAVMFALSIDYQMFIVSRIRDEFAAGASVEAAIDTGMRRTAGVVTCAALSMLAVFASFAMADVTSLRVFGVGLAVAVTLEATLVRLVLLPALLRLLGRRAWWPLTSSMAGEDGPSSPAAGPQPAIPGQISAPPCRP